MQRHRSGTANTRRGAEHAGSPQQRFNFRGRTIVATRCKATSAQASTSQAQSSPRVARTKEQLQSPVDCQASCKGQQDVKIFPGKLSLATYMTLPVEQYFILDPGQIKWLGANRFLLLVPRISILGAWLEPEVEISVTSTSKGVRLQAENCRMRGSQLIESWRLDERFCMRFVTELSWSQPPRVEQVPNSTNGNGGGEDAVVVAVGDGHIMGDAKLDVWCEVIPPFNLMPREALKASTNAVLGGVMRTLLPLFLKRLAADYGKWATQPAYRTQRAQCSKPLA